MESVLLVFGFLLLGSRSFLCSLLLARTILASNPLGAVLFSFFFFLIVHTFCFFCSPFLRETSEAGKRSVAPLLLLMCLLRVNKRVHRSLFSSSLAKAVAFWNTTEPSCRLAASIRDALLAGLSQCTIRAKIVTRQTREEWRECSKGEWLAWHAADTQSRVESFKTGEEEKRKSVMVLWSLRVLANWVQFTRVARSLVESFTISFFFFFLHLLYY